MATSFSTSTDWFLDLWDPTIVDGGSNPPGALYVAPAGKTWWRYEWTATLHRVGEGLVKHWPETGNTLDGAQITWKHGSDYKSFGTGYTYTCEEDRLNPDPPGSGIYTHSRIYVYRSGWGLKTAPVSPDPPDEPSSQDP